MGSGPASTLRSSAGDLALHAIGFELSLPSNHKAPNTIKSYLASIALLDEFLASKGMPRDVDNIRREQAEPSMTGVTRQLYWCSWTPASLWASSQA
jgi:hypothetical protein